MEVSARILELLWLGGLAATPVALAVGMICRVWRLRPATRHLLWLCALASFLTPMIGTVIWRPEWFRSERLLAATGAPEVHAPAIGVSGLTVSAAEVGSSRVDLQACKLEYSIVSPK